VRTRLEIRNRVATDTRETQINTSIEEWINQTLAEINDPAWAFEQVIAMRGYNHNWSFNRRKATLIVGSGIYTKLLLHCDGIDASTTFIDETEKIITANGTAQIDTAQSKFGGASGLFGGVDAYLSTPDHANWNFGIGNFTIDLWIRFNTLTNAQIFMGQYEDANNYWYLMKDANANGNKLSMKFVDGATTKGNYVMTSSWSGVAINTWYHLRFVRSSGVGYIFIDGTSQTLTESTAFSSNDVGDMSAVLTIGQQNSASYFDGWMDEIRVSKGIAISTADFTSPTDAFTYSVDTEFYQLPRDVDKISLIRQTATPIKIRFIPDDLFYDYIPNPTATGNPKWYRIWEEEGVRVRLSFDDTIEVISSSASDTTQTIRIVGYDTNGLLRTESLTLTGQTVVSGTITYDAGKVLRVSKSDNTTGVITVRKATGDVTLVQLAPTERAGRFKIISLYPIPTSAITLYIEYFTTIRRLEGDNDVPDLDEKWLWVVRLGAMAKVYQYQNKESLFNTTQALFASAVRSMVKADLGNVDYIPYLRSQLDSIGQRDILDLCDLPLG